MGFVLCFSRNQVLVAKQEKRSENSSFGPPTWAPMEHRYYLHSIGARTRVRTLRYKDLKAEKLEPSTYDGHLRTLGATYGP